MRVVYHKESDMLNIILSDEPSTESSEKDGVVLDYDKNGRVVCIEIEDASRYDISKFSIETVDKKKTS